MQTQLNRARQEGVAMIVSLMMLILVSLVVLQSARSSNVELLIGNNTQQSTESLVRAENSVIAGETRIETDIPGAPVTFAFGAEDGIYLDSDIDVADLDWEEDIIEESGAGSLRREYVIEYLGPATMPGSSITLGAGGAPNIVHLYRVSGRGQSGIGGTRVVQTIYAMSE